MANPQLENGHIKIANEIWDALIRFRLPGEQMQCLMVIFRKTYGWNKKRDAISLSQFAEMTGLRKQNVHRALKGLSSKLITRVIKTDDGSAHIYEINKDFERWKKQGVIKTDKASLSKLITTKDTTTKDKYISSQNSKVPYKKIIEKYHEILPELPRVIKVTSDRKKHLKARWNEEIETPRGRTPNSIEFWEAYFHRVRDSSFLMGDNDRGWTADFDFLITKSKFIAIIEGAKYY